MLHWDLSKTEPTGDGALLIPNQAGEGFEGELKVDTVARLTAIYQCFGTGATPEQRASAKESLEEVRKATGRPL